MTTISTPSDTAGGVSMSSLASAIEARDADGVLAWFTDDATVTLLDRDHPPASPMVLHGTEEIGDYYRDICGRNMEHSVRDAVATPDGIAYTQHCRYPDGTAVLCAVVARTHDGKIQSQTGVQVWDA